MEKPRKPIVAISGSAQAKSYTSRALAVVTRQLSRSAFEVVTFEGAELHLDFPGRPETPDAVRLRNAIREAAAVVLATPEYHGGMSALMKLCIETLGFPSALSGKPTALLGVASGRIGAVKSIEQLRTVCSHVGALVVPNAISVANVQRAFDASGRPTDPAIEASLEGLAASLLAFMRDYVCPKYVLEETVRSGQVPEAAPWAVTV